MAEVLELPHLSQHHRMAEMYVGTGRVKTKLDSQLPARLGRFSQFLSQLFFGKNLALEVQSVL